MLVEFENVLLIRDIFFNWGKWGQMCLWNLKCFFLIGGIFVYNWGDFFLSWGQKIILRSRKSAILGIIWTPVLDV